jgi:hypothetical protein
MFDQMHRSTLGIIDDSVLSALNIVNLREL